MKKWFLLTLALSASFTTVALPARAQRVCKVSDPAKPPLSIRTYPNGQRVNALGQVVNALQTEKGLYVEDIASDSQGRSWAKIGGYYNGNYRVWGWVSSESISCDYR